MTQKKINIQNKKARFEFELIDQYTSAIDELKKLPFVDSEHLLHTALKEGKKVLAEGAQGSLLGHTDFLSY